MKRRKKRTPKPDAPAPRPAAELPDWLREMPPEPSYGLVMWDDAGGSVQTVPTSREEYLQMKLHLAQLRGIELSAEQAEKLREAV